MIITAKTGIPIPEQDIAQFCKRHHIRTLSLFGSVLRDDFTPQSDVDILVEFEPGQCQGFSVWSACNESFPNDLAARSICVHPLR
jgi:predicted nucleotidyltransferase